MQGDLLRKTGHFRGGAPGKKGRCKRQWCSGEWKRGPGTLIQEVESSLMLGQEEEGREVVTSGFCGEGGEAGGGPGLGVLTWRSLQVLQGEREAGPEGWAVRWENSARGVSLHPRERAGHAGGWQGAPVAPSVQASLGCVAGGARTKKGLI